MTKEQKSVLESKTFWGLLVVLFAPAFASYGLPVEGLSGDDLAKAAGAVLTLYGRMTASKGLGLK